jgi:small basic protein (TIGR04137 family)
MIGRPVVDAGCGLATMPGLPGQTGRGSETNDATLGFAWACRDNGEEDMSRHRTLKTSSFATRSRNVLKREERLEVLSKEGRWDDKKRVVGLPKTKVPGKVKGK